MAQEEIEALMVERARAGRSVVRLKGGDPFVFGRGGEEAEALAAAGVEFEVVPGVTAGVAAPAYAGIPVTHRDDASAVAFVTGHEDPEKDESALDWEALARFPGTLVLYMGVKNLPVIAERLVSRPAATRPSPRRRSSAAPSPASGPSSRPWPGCPTRSPRPGSARRRSCSSARSPPAARRSPGSSAARCTAGASSSPAPAPRRAASRRRLRGARRRGGRAAGDPDRAAARRRDEVRDAVADLHTYALVCLTSPNGVRLLFEAMAAQGRDARALANATVAAIGPGTAAALAERGVIADVVPERFVAEALVEALAGGRGRRPPGAGRPRRRGPRRAPRRARASAARKSTSSRSTRRSREDPDAGGDRGAPASADYVTFTSSSTVRNLLEAVGDALPARRPGRLDRPGHQRRRRASSASRSTSRPSATTSRGWSRRWSPTRGIAPRRIRAMERIPNTAHTSRPWRIREVVYDFDLEDVWALPGSGAQDDFPRFVQHIASMNAGTSSSRAARALWAIRWKLGELFGWDDPADGLGTRVASLRERLPADLRDAPLDVEFDSLPFEPLYLTEDEFAAEIANKTVHGVLHRRPGPRRSRRLRRPDGRLRQAERPLRTRVHAGHPPRSGT